METGKLIKDRYEVQLAIGDLIEYFIEGRLKRVGIVEHLFYTDSAIMIRDMENKNMSTARFGQSVRKLTTEQAMMWKLENA